MRPDGENSQREEKVRQLLVRVTGRVQQLLGNIQAMYSSCHCCLLSLCPRYRVVQPAVTYGQTLIHRVVLCKSEALGTCKHLSLPTELGHKVGDVKSQVHSDPWEDYDFGMSREPRRQLISVQFT